MYQILISLSVKIDCEFNFKPENWSASITKSVILQGKYH